MKHNLEVTLIIVSMFVISQIIGLFLISSYDYYFGKTAEEQGIEKAKLSFVYETVPPEIEIKTAFDITQIILSLVFAIAVATLAFFLLSRLKVTVLIKAWFTFVIFICLTLAFSLSLYPIIGVKFISLFGTTFSLAELIALPLSLIFTYLKIFKRNILAHNFSELFVYPALAVIFLPLLNVLVASILLIIISFYDMWAVWKTKHMIKLAKFQMNHLKIFTGFFFPYINKKDRIKIKRVQAMAKKIKNKREKNKKLRERFRKLKIKANVAALGGGDVAFPLMFAATVFFAFNLLAALIIILCSTLSLMFLFYISEKGKFYPAMPFLTIGCFIGLALVLLFF